jgi:hypothetical protein
MRFLVLISPIIKFLINKYQSNISLQGVESDILSKFKASEVLGPSECKTFIQILSSIRKYLADNNIQYQRDSVKKLVGDGSQWKGFLNILMETQHDIFFCPYEPGNLQNFSNIDKRIGNGDMSDVRVIAPLNLDESDEIYTFFQQKLKIPVYPLIVNDATSKWLKNVVFAPLAPRGFYFPEGTCAADFNDKILALARRMGITHFILKDEYDFDLRPILPYAVVPASKLDQACHVFYEKIKGIPNYGGLVLEEFLANGDAIEIVTTHIFNKTIRVSHVIEKVRLNPFKDGGLYDTFVKDVTKQAVDAAPVNLDAIDVVVAKFYPYLFSSIEYIVSKNLPRVIDVNSVSNTMKTEKPALNMNPDAIFKEFIARVVASENAREVENQMRYLGMIKQLYTNLRNYGPACFTGDKVISLIDGAEKNVKEFLVVS